MDGIEPTSQAKLTSFGELLSSVAGLVSLPP